jgi:hypothetical protein
MCRTRVALTAVCLLVAAAGIAAAQPPLLTNAKVTTRPAAAALDGQVRQLATEAAEPTWIGWSVPTRKQDSGNCCWSSTNGVTTGCGCQLETGNTRSMVAASGSGTPIKLEAGRLLLVLLRIEDHQIQKVASYSDTCPLDAGGRPVIWIDGVNPSGSVSFLAKLSSDTLADGKPSRPANGALAALSQHADPSALGALIELAKNNGSAKVRSQALFWLAQQAGERAAATIVNAIQNDPDTGVKKQAVFALSQLPKDDGVPKLIEIAKTNRNPEVRKQAVFWLGQSHDPRALRFFEEILTK